MDINENKAYTVSELASKLHMTERTIRNYLKEGILSGSRIGGQWRFTNEDIEKLIHNSTFRNQVRDKASVAAKSYIDKTLSINGEITVCAVVDYRNSDQEYMDHVEAEVAQIAREYKGNVRLIVISENGVGRATIMGTLECVRRVLDALTKLEQKQ